MHVIMHEKKVSCDLRIRQRYQSNFKEEVVIDFMNIYNT
jgi:hypothetical protein